MDEGGGAVGGAGGSGWGCGGMTKSAAIAENPQSITHSAAYRIKCRMVFLLLEYAQKTKPASLNSKTHFY
jgi:hypothetical protein